MFQEVQKQAAAYPPRSPFDLISPTMNGADVSVLCTFLKGRASFHRTLLLLSLSVPVSRQARAAFQFSDVPLVFPTDACILFPYR